MLWGKKTKKKRNMKKGKLIKFTFIARREISNLNCSDVVCKSSHLVKKLNYVSFQENPRI